MNSNSKNAQEVYQMPEICVIEALSEGVICDSANGNIDPWENDGDTLGAPRNF
ncbi:MAG: hypothetical protein MJZ04_08660 [Bacteroidales bacterium]|nr:hypothetical protein [Bacteroidales bacterium]